MSVGIRNPRKPLVRESGSAAPVTPVVDGHPVRILVAADCPVTADLEQDLRRHGYDVRVVSNGRDVLELYPEYDLLLLDTDLPDLDGVSVCQAIRQRSDIPIIGFTSASEEVDRVLLLEIGCDDCIARPYRPRELHARIKAVLRRTGTTRRHLAAAPREADELEIGRLVIDPVRREARLDDRPLTLTRKEFDLLQTLAAEPGRVFGRQELMTAVWEYPEQSRISAQASRTIDTHVSSLRSKLGNRDWITNVRGIGFRFETFPAEPAACAATPLRAVDGYAAATGSAGPIPFRPQLVSVRSATGSG